MKLFTSFAAAMVISAGVASAATLDFDSGVATFSGNNNLTGYSQDGFSFQIDEFYSGGQGSDGANLFNSDSCDSNVQACGVNDDTDLLNLGRPGVSGNVLIRQQSNVSVDDDSSGQGDIVFSLSSGPAFRILGFSGIDGFFELLVNGVSYGTLGDLDNNNVGTLTLANATPLIGVGDRFTIRYDGSGGIDNIVLAPVPLPASALLLLGGIGAVAATRRSKRS